MKRFKKISKFILSFMIMLNMLFVFFIDITFSYKNDFISHKQEQNEITRQTDITSSSGIIKENIQMKNKDKINEDKLKNETKEECTLVNNLEPKLKKEFKQKLRSGSTTPISGTSTIAANEIAPANYLQIIDRIAGAKVEILETGPGVNATKSLNPWEVANDLWSGKFNDAIFSKLSGNGYGGYTIQFKPSNTSAYGYTTDPKAGWDNSDLNLSTSSMWVKIKYTNAAYYDGELVDAIAVIKITPFKNRTEGASWSNGDYTNNTYYPLVQISDLLYRGWNWQNVNEINVDLQLFKKGSSSPIQFSEGNFGDMEATYYTVNSLNPTSIQGEGENPAATYGPEYVLPKKGTYSGAYVIPSSHIVTSYGGDTSMGTQYAYNGGSSYWDGDDPSHHNWSQNSVLFTTKATTHLNFTMGNLSRDPQQQSVKRTNFVWTSISTQSFTNSYVKYIDIPVEKKWQGPGAGDDVSTVTVKLYAKYKLNYQDKEYEFRNLTLTKDSNGNWKGKFIGVPDLPSLKKLLEKHHKGGTITDQTYIVKEVYLDGKEITNTDYESTINGNMNSGFVINNKRVKNGLTVIKNWQDQNGNQITGNDTSKFPEVKVLLKRKIKTGNYSWIEDSSFSKEVSLNYDGNWKNVINGLDIKDSQNREYVYYIIEQNIPKGFRIVSYKPSSSSNPLVCTGIEIGNKTTDENKLEVTNAKDLADVNIEKVWLDVNGVQMPFNQTSNFGNIKVNLYRKVGNIKDDNFVKEVTLSYTKNWKEKVTELSVHNSDGELYNYYIEEDATTLPDGFSIKGYTPTSGINLSQDSTNNILKVENIRDKVDIPIEKIWYDVKGNKITTEGPPNLVVKLYRTTDGTTKNGELVQIEGKNEVLLTYNQGAWSYKYKNLPIKDNNGKYYTYYIQEVKPSGYLEIGSIEERSITFKQNDNTIKTLTLKNKLNPVYPATGGNGSKVYLTVGITAVAFGILLREIIQNKKERRKNA